MQQNPCSTSILQQDEQPQFDIQQYKQQQYHKKYQQQEYSTSELQSRIINQKNKQIKLLYKQSSLSIQLEQQISHISKTNNYNSNTHRNNNYNYNNTNDNNGYHNINDNNIYNNKRLLPNQSNLSQPPLSSQPQLSNIGISSANKKNISLLHKKYSQYQSISPQKSILISNKNNKFPFNRSLYSSQNNKNQIHINKNNKNNIININNINNVNAYNVQLQRTSYSPTLSPQRKSIYWQSWLLPMNATLRQGNHINSNNINNGANNIQLSKLSAKSYIAMLSDSNQIFLHHNISLQRQIASLTKIMTAYTVLNICSMYNIKIREHTVSINKSSAYMNGTTAGLKLDQQVLIIDLLYGLLLPSGNDSAIALAQYFGKFLSFKFAQDNNNKLMNQNNTMDKFRQFKDYYDSQYNKDSIKLFTFQMNKNCHKIGLKNTHFTNPTGLSDKNNYSTVKDIAILTSHCLKNQTLKMIFKKKYHVCQVYNPKLCQARQIQWKNTNRHLFQFRQCIGVKTGITPNAGPCLSAAYRIMGRELIVIVLDCASVQDRYKDAQILFKYCRKKLEPFEKNITHQGLLNYW